MQSEGSEYGVGLDTRTAAVVVCLPVRAPQVIISKEPIIKPTETSQSMIKESVLDGLPATTDATTSKVVVNNSVLRVVYFAFGANQELTEHTSPRAVVMTVLSGQIAFTVSAEAATLDAGDVIYLAPNEPHSVKAITDSHLQLVMVDTEA